MHLAAIAHTRRTRRTGALLLALLLLAACCAGARAADEGTAQPGDLDGDGRVTAADAAGALRLAAGAVAPNAASSADVTGDLAVTAADATAILLPGSRTIFLTSSARSTARCSGRAMRGASPISARC